MARAKFAPITAALLARKGEARPWGDGSAQTWPAPANSSHARVNAIEPPAGKLEGDKPPTTPAFTIAAVSATGGPRKLTLRLSASQYERLGLIATKRDTTRQRLVQQVLDEFLTTAAGAYGGACGCIGGSCRRQDHED